MTTADAGEDSEAAAPGAADSGTAGSQADDVRADDDSSSGEAVPRPGPLELLQDRLRALVAAGRIGRFVSVGAAGATLETVIVALLTSGVLARTAPPLLAKAVGAEASITLMFIVNDRWTFAGEGEAGFLSRCRRYGRSHLVRVGGLAVAFATLFVLTSFSDMTILVGGADLWPTVANVVAIGAGMTLNYVAESLVTWRVHHGG